MDLHLTVGGKNYAPQTRLSNIEHRRAEQLQMRNWGRQGKGKGKTINWEDEIDGLKYAIREIIASETGLERRVSNLEGKR